MFCNDSEEKLDLARVAFEVERVFSALLSIQVKKKKKRSKLYRPDIVIGKRTRNFPPA